MIEKPTPNDSYPEANLWCELQAPDGTGLMEPSHTNFCLVLNSWVLCLYQDEIFDRSLARSSSGPPSAKIVYFARISIPPGTPLLLAAIPMTSHITTVTTPIMLVS